MKRALWWGLGLVLVLIVIGMFAPSRTPAPAAGMTAEQKTQVIAVVEKAVKDGLITKIDATGNQAWVNPRAWAGANAQEKETVARLLAKYCEAQGDVARITIYDAMSAQEIAGVSAGRFYVK